MPAAATFSDPMLAAVTFLREALATRDEDYATGVTVGTTFPVDGEVPFAMVRWTGTTITQRIDAEALVSVTIWHTSEARALALAVLCQALFAAHPGDSDVRCYSPDAGPYPASDPDNGNPLASFSVAARLRPTTL